MKQDSATGRIVSRFTEEQLAAMCASYQAGRSMTEVAAEFGTDQGNVWYHLHRRGIEIRPRKRMTPEQRNEAIRLYEAGWSAKEIGDRFGFDQSSVWDSLKRRGVQIRSSGDALRRHTLDQAAFDVITEESAYWAGFLMADGNISSGRHVVNLGLAESDAAHVVNFRSFLKASHPITVEKNRGHLNSQPLCRISICSVRICAALARFGIVPQKSLTARALLLENNRDFWRGMVDGDGFVFMTGRNMPVLGLVGSRGNVELFAAWIGTVTGRRPTVRPAAKIFNTRVTGRSAGLVAEALYVGSSVWLTRKREAAEFIIARAARIQAWRAEVEERCRALPGEPICAAPGCVRRILMRGMCNNHYHVDRRRRLKAASVAP